MTFPEYLGQPAELPGRGEPARSARVRSWPHAEWLAVAAVGFGAITSSLDVGVITVSYPRFVHQLHRPLSQIAWLVLATQLTVVATLVLFGRRADAVGRKRVYLDGFVLFVIGAAACALSPNFACLIAARIVEALGVAMIQANSVALVASSVKPEHRTTALGIQASAQATGLAIGPFLGGLLVTALPWRGLFLVSVPLAVVAFIASVQFLPRSRTAVPHERFNIVSAISLAIASAGVIGGVTMGARSGWGGWPVTLCVGGALGAGSFAWSERRAHTPMIDRTVLAAPGARRALVSITITWVTFFGLITSVPFYVERHLHRSTSVAGAAVVAIPIGLMATAPMIGALRRRLSVRSISAGAAVLVMIAVAALALRPGLMVLVPALALAGVGIGASNTLNSTAIMSIVNDAERGVASGIVNLARAGGSATGVALATALVTSTTAFDALIVTASLSLLVVLTTPRSGTQRTVR